MISNKSYTKINTRHKKIVKLYIISLKEDFTIEITIKGKVGEHQFNCKAYTMHYIKICVHTLLLELINSKSIYIIGQ